MSTSPANAAVLIKPSPLLSPSPRRKIAIAIDLSDESAYAVRWAADHYLRPDDAVVLLHVTPTSVLYGADWGWVPSGYSLPVAGDQKSLDELDSLTGIEFRIHVVKDRDMKEQLCLEVDRLGLSAVVMGSRWFGAAAAKRSRLKKRLGSVSDYCVQHCVCPVVVVRCPDDVSGKFRGSKEEEEELVLHPVPEEDAESINSDDSEDSNNEN